MKVYTNHVSQTSKNPLTVWPMPEYRCEKCRAPLVFQPPRPGDVPFAMDRHQVHNKALLRKITCPVDMSLHMPIVVSPKKKMLKGTFHCQYCTKQIFTDGSGFYTAAAQVPSTAYWQDSGGLFFCLDADGEYIMAHRPLRKEVLASTEAMITGGAGEQTEWSEELSEKDRRSFERWAAGGLKVTDDPVGAGLVDGRVVDRRQIMPPQDF